jgi:hypothetical protein
LRTYDENGNTNTLNYGDIVGGQAQRLYIGQPITNCIMGKRTVAINSYVSSIEYMLDGTNPRIIVSTQYPSSPERTRKRKVNTRGVTII